MERRSILSLLLVSPLGLLIPQTAKAHWLPGSRYVHFDQFLDEVADFASDLPNPKINSCGDPAGRLIGFMVFSIDGDMETMREFYVQISQLPRLIKAMPDTTKRRLVEQSLTTWQGRIGLARSIQDEAARLKGLGPIARAISRPAAKQRLAKELMSWG